MTWQPAGIVYPDVELWATGYIRTALTGRGESYAADVYVSNRVPKQRRDRMVIVRRDGGPTASLRDVPRLSVRVWATTEQDAVDLARLVNALVFLAPDGDPVLSVNQQSGPTSVPDESGAFLRYSVLEIATRGDAVA